MDIIIFLLKTLPLIVLGFFFFAVSVILYIIFYIYMNINLKDISKIIFKDERKYRRPLEPFNFIFLSLLPTTFWRETLNIKYQVNFKKLYGKDFYYPLDREQLIELLSNYKGYFLLQYAIFISTTFGITFLSYAYVADKYF
ncbi:hypothetical protein [Acinetobacter pullicarnis]|uniref:hypothetical protein n=1 Tax=Acinetobacter pullicarnis TaxID=2576829 RepID=UPI001E46F71D|nr:hypothetical protein [Acinetobacter pullicarnis]